MFPKKANSLGPPDIGIDRSRSQEPVRVETFPRHETYLQQPPALRSGDSIRTTRDVYASQ